jgi:DNA-binding response OmpR family regulator
MVRNFLPTVVVADPDMFYQDRMVHLLQESFRCIRTNSLRETYRAILNERPSIVILELNQPDGDGLNLIAHLRTDPTLKDILIACVTQRSNTWDKVLAWRAGADDYIAKPLTRTFQGQMLLLKRAGLMARV